MHRILSIDVGMKNCAFYVEDFFETEFEKEKNPYKVGTVVLWELVDFTCGENALKLSFDNLFDRMTQYLDLKTELWDTLSGIVIERQLGKNNKAQRIEQYLYTYFKIRYASFKYMTRIPPSKKTKIFGVHFKEKKDRKIWASKQALEICIARKDKKNWNFLCSNVDKLDDLADACLQLKAWQKEVFC